MPLDSLSDEAIIIRERTIVDSFENQAFVPPPVDFLAANFERQVQTVTDFGKKLGAMTIAQAQLAFQEEVLIGLRNDKIGVYSLYHDAATYETTTLLDASKTGLRLKKTVEEADQRLIGRIPRARCFDVVNGQSRAKFERSVATHLTENENPPDSDIEEPYHRATRAAVGNTPFAKAMASDLDALRSHINELRIRYGVLNRQLARSKEEQHFPESVKNRKKGPAKQTDNCMLPLMRDFRQPIMNIEYLHSMGNIDEIKASFAFSLGQKFGFAMGFQDICEIKRRAELKRGPFNKVAVIDGAKNMGGSARRLLKHMGDGV
ncbi:hypothetical protein K438DRAFT_1954355 [Mycena galopus ATCC 62051]|nr:hypothetical protein K438DRAFT_1954355 [Mycena galopus ATCC 62051]